uniref:BTB domain-containing protein n=1 Tax=Panagrellus redivivus TaxID=6233 RepID=A0A7E4W7J3_PANRE
MVIRTMNEVKITLRRARQTFHVIYARPRAFFSSVLHLIANNSFYRPLMRIDCPPGYREFLLFKFLGLHDGKFRTAPFLSSPYDNGEITAVKVSLSPPENEAENLRRVLNHRLRRPDLPMLEVMAGTKTTLQVLGQLKVLPLELLVGNISKQEKSNH